MIGWLSGKIIDKHHPGRIVFDVNGVGYDVETSLPTFFQLEHHSDQIQLHIHTIVREDALLLYGFLERQERALFRALIKVNGIGPKSAMAILSSITPDEFIRCIHQQNPLLLTKLPGIGKKTAERLVIEMKDNIQHISSTEPQTNPVLLNQQEEAICALEALGYKRSEMTKVVQKLDNGQSTCEQLIRQALQFLGTR